MQSFFDILIISLFVTSCSKTPTFDSSICSPLSEINPIVGALTRADIRDNYKRCLKRSVYKLGVSVGTSYEIAEAAMRSCKNGYYNTLKPY